MAGSDEDRGRSRTLGAADQGRLGISRVLGGRTIERSGDAVCDSHRTRGGKEKHGFPGYGLSVVWPRNHYDRFLIWASKPRSKVWASKSPRQFLGLGLKTKWKEVYRFVPQNR
jgi:hypothetical protein